MYNTSSYLSSRPKDNGKLYFLKPIEFDTKTVEANSGDFTFIPDFTYNYIKDSSQEEVAIKFSLNGSAAIQGIDSIQFYKHDTLLTAVKKVNTLFIEKKNRTKWLNRFSTQVTYQDFLTMLQAKDQLMGLIVTPNHQIKVEAPKKWRYASETVYPTFRHEIGINQKNDKNDQQAN